MKDIVKLYCLPDPPIDDPQRCLTQHLNEPDPYELPIPLRDEDHCRPSTLHWYPVIPELCLKHFYYPTPIGRVRLLLGSCLRQSRLKILCLHVGHPPLPP